MKHNIDKAINTIVTVRELLTELDGKGLACDDPVQVLPDLLLLFGINLDTPLRQVSS